MSQDLTTNICQQTISRNPSNKGIKVTKSMVNSFQADVHDFGYWSIVANFVEKND
jgi:hypothetical protein